MASLTTSDLIRKYNRPGPRYTSYPTALQFQPVDDSGPLFEETRCSTAPLSLYFHLPFCESLCWFCACTTVITRDTRLADAYVEALIREMDLSRPLLNLDNREAIQLHFGGGSPSFLDEKQLARLCGAIRERFSFSENAEISVELDPRTMSEGKVAVLAEQGFNRASFGVQDVNPAVQKAVHRIQPDELNRQCVDWVRAKGFGGLNIDLIYGLPHQTVDSFAQTLETVLAYEPDRLAVFSYAHVPWVAPAQKILERSTLPDPETKFSMLLKTIEVLTDRGYVYIGMDHFAREDDELTRALSEGALHRNFQGYTTRAGSELCGFGMSSISMGESAYRQNTKELADWHAAIAGERLPVSRGYRLTGEDKLRREVIMNIMCSGTIRYPYYHDKYGIDFAGHFADALEALAEPEKDGLVAFAGDGFRVTERGRLLLRNIAMPFDAYLSNAERRHAKTI